MTLERKLEIVKMRYGRVQLEYERNLSDKNCKYFYQSISIQSLCCLQKSTFRRNLILTIGITPKTPHIPMSSQLHRQRRI